MNDFFQHQDRARRNTRVLVGLMALAVVGMGTSIYVLIQAVQRWSIDPMSDGPPPALLQPQLWLICVLGTAAVVGIASLVRTFSLRGGGAQIAEMLGGRLVSGNPRDTLEKRLLNVVEEIAIAAGLPVPRVFVMESETGINAFAAGFATDDAAIAVTRGCLEKLTREELQGVIAHEFSHVLNGDMRLNIRLMGLVFGIVCIGLLGRFLMRLAASSRTSSRRSRSNSPMGLFLIGGLGLFLIGLIGEVFGKLVKAAVSRQREFLADASAVQFTRNPQGIAGALKKIGGYSEGAAVRANSAEEASHFFFGDIHKHLFAHSVMATHPPLSERIKRVDPTFAGEFPSVGPGVAEPDEGPMRAFAGPAASAREQAAPHQAQRIVAQVGTAGAEAIAVGQHLLAEIPATLRDAAESGFSACAIVYALLLSDQPALRQLQRTQLDKIAGSALHAETLRLLPHVHALPRRERLPLVELLAPALHQLSPEQRAAFARAVQALIDADESVSIFEYVLAHTLRARVEGMGERHSRVPHRSLTTLRSELELLLSLLAHAGASDPASAAAAFRAAASRLGRVQVSLLEPSPRLLSALGPALAQIASLPPVPASQVVDACVHAVVADHRVTDDEITLLRAVCDALGAPLPQLA
jgi:Zn-dependent protease with chaperone function